MNSYEGTKISLLSSKASSETVIYSATGSLCSSQTYKTTAVAGDGYLTCPMWPWIVFLSFGKFIHLANSLLLTASHSERSGTTDKQSK